MLPLAADERRCLPALKPRCCLPIASWTTTVCECCVAEAVDWRKRHLDALREMESEERRWRGVEQILRRLVQRLCAVAMGNDPRLDTQLEGISAATRRDADEDQLRNLFDSLTGAVMAGERAAIVLPAPTRSPPAPAAAAPAAVPAPPPVTVTATVKTSAAHSTSAAAPI